MTADRYAPLLHEDLVTPVHHHDDRHDHLVVETPDGREAMSPERAAAHVARVRPPVPPEVVEDACGWHAPRRRTVLMGAGLGFGALLAESAVPRYAFGATTGRDLLVVVFMRGGADGLSLVPPVTDTAYAAARPGIKVTATQALPLDGTFGLHPALAPLKSLYDARQLAVVVGAGNPGVTRSHFEDMASMEWAAPASMRSGWLGRHLQTSGPATGTIRALTRGDQVSMSLTSPVFEATAIKELANFGLWPGGADQTITRTRVTSIIDGMYARAGGEAAQAASTVLRSISSLAAQRDAAASRPKAADGYTSAFFEGMRDIAAVARSTAGLEVACIDNDDWDMHRQLGQAGDRSSWLWRRATDLARGIDVLRTELGDQWARTTVVTMSEFGRRVQENGDMGVDHGHGNVMFVAGGAVRGGRVYGSLPPLTAGNLVQGDVPIRVDYRQVLSEIVSVRLGNAAALPTIFPGFTPGTPLGVV